MLGVTTTKGTPIFENCDGLLELSKFPLATEIGDKHWLGENDPLTLCIKGLSFPFELTELLRIEFLLTGNDGITPRCLGEPVFESRLILT